MRFKTDNAWRWLPLMLGTLLVLAVPAWAEEQQVQGGLGEGEHQSNYDDFQLFEDESGELQVQMFGQPGGTPVVPSAPILETAGWDPERGVDRPARIANATGNLLRLARRLPDRSLVLINAVRNQRRLHGEIDIGLAALDSRPGWLRWFIGPDAKWLNDTELKLRAVMEPLTEARQVRDDVQDGQVKELIGRQLQTLDRVMTEQQAELDAYIHGFNLGRFVRELLDRF